MYDPIVIRRHPGGIWIDIKLENLSYIESLKEAARILQLEVLRYESSIR